MNKEIERKFLVLNDDFKNEAVKSSQIIQGYLSKDPERTVRVRVSDENAFLTVKGAGKENGAERFEYEIAVDKEDALQLLELCIPEIISKTRFFIPAGKHTFEVDVFDGKNKGLVLCEIELENLNDFFEKPNWLGKEVTGDKRYYNSYLSEHPYINRNKDSKSENIVALVSKKMIDYFGKDVRRINHALKVYAYSKTIGELENISSDKMRIVELSALLHDIGIKICEEKYGSTAGKYQEKESPLIAKQILSDFNLPEETLNRILFIIGNHHTYSKIDSIDFQILAEADFLVNFEEANEPKKNIPAVKKDIFKTKTGLNFLESIF